MEKIERNEKVKKNKIILLMAVAFTAILSFLGISKVNAQTYYETLVEDKVPNVYYTRRGGGKPYMSAQYTTYTMNGKVVYCIEPGVNITTHDYNGEIGLVNSPYDAATNKKIELIGHYGYDYPGHQTLRYRMAAQSLIWETTGGQIIEFWTEASGWGDYININKERNEIMSLVNAHYNKPSFNGTSMEVIVGQEYKITDTNGLMSEYDLYKADGIDVRISGNDIYFTPRTTGNLSLSVARKHYDNYTTIVFKGNDNASQKMGYFRFSDPVVATINLNVLGGKIKLTKVDSENNTTTPLGQASLIGAKYDIINSSGNVVETITIGNDNTAITNHLSLGTYTIKEKAPSKGYYLDNNVYTVNITSGDTVNVTVKEQVIKNYISILKQYDYVNGNTTFLNAEANIVFEIFYPDGTKYGEVKTDKNGYATLDIPYGTWKFHQVNSNTGFEKIYDFYITVDENSELEQYYNILNNKISAYLQVVKKDSETGKTIAIPNVKFKIQNTDTKEYVSQYVGGKVYDNFMTDENGVFTTYLKLEAGNYKLVEIESPSGYLLSKDGLEFTIGEDTEYNYTTYGAIVVVEFENTPIKGQVEIYKNGDKFVVEDGTFSYKDILLKGIEFNVYADEDIKSADGNYLYYNKGDLVETLTTDENGYVKSKKLPLGKYYLVEVETKENYVLDTEEYHFELTEKDNKTAIVYDTYRTYNYLKKGTLEFTKTDFSTSEPISDVDFEIYTEKDELIYFGKTNKDGKIVINELAVGKYYIVEKDPAEGYVSNDEKVLFEIKENGEVVKANMTNKKITSTLKITKVDEEEVLLSGIKFGIYDLEDNLTKEVITDENGLIEIELEYGKYYFKEIATLEQYVINDKKVYFEVKEDGAVIEEKVVNEFVVGTLEFTKTDLITGEVIPNTLIEVYTDKDELVFSGKTDENGKVVIEELRYGKYYIIEKEAVTGFVITEEKVYFEIKEDGKIVKAEMTNRPILGTLEFTKVDISTSEPLPNTLIEIYNENEELVFSGRTDENGMIIIEELRYGKYYVLEKEAPNGYILNEEKMFFEILEDGEVVKTTMVNEQVVIEVPNTGLSDYYVVEIISGLLMLGGIGVIIYAKNKRKK